jgi:hypothetical protein
MRAENRAHFSSSRLSYDFSANQAHSDRQR